MKPIAVLIILTSLYQCPVAQNISKINYALQKTMVHQTRSNAAISLLVKGDIDKIKTTTELIGGVYKYGAGNVCAIKLPINAVQVLANKNFVQRIEGNTDLVYSLNDKVLENNNIDSVNAGFAPLQQPYDGEGVIFGMIDTGIDPDHPDFKNADSTTRILFIWDQAATNYSLAPYGYGLEWTAADINNGVSTQKDTTWGGHGTWVASVAAGNGLATGNYKGAAPKADIIVVAINPSLVNYLDNGPNLAAVTDAVDYIYKKADSLGKPCVINISLGGQSGSHDGKDLAAQLISNMINAKKGRALVTSAGNQAQTKLHLGYDVTSDTVFTWFRHFQSNEDFCTIDGGVYFTVYADTADFNNVNFSFGADKVSPCCGYRGGTPFTDISASINQVVYDSVFNTAGTLIGVVQTFTELVEGVYALHVEIKTDSNRYMWRFSTTGSGRFDIWSGPFVFGTCSSEMIVNPFFVAPQFKDIDQYMAPDNNKTIGSSYTCSDDVITVGAYVNRRNFINNNGSLQTINGVPGAIASFSSIGPTRDGRIKPDITAPGANILAGGPLNELASMTNTQLALGGLHSVVNGTSFSSPATAGFVALYLQANPDATAQEILTAIKLTATQDNRTGATPNTTWGYGKLNGFQSLQAPLVFGCIDTNALNYDFLANVEDGSCKYATGIGDVLIDNMVQINVYPNPASGNINFKYLINTDYDIGELQITNILGKSIKRITLTRLNGLVKWNTEQVEKGIYVYNIIIDGKQVRPGKLMVY